MPPSVPESLLGAASTSAPGWARQESGDLIGPCRQWPLFDGGVGRTGRRGRELRLGYRPRLVLVPQLSPSDITSKSISLWSLRPKDKSTHYWSHPQVVRDPGGGSRLSL